MHRVPDYAGATKEERLQRIDDIVAIAKAGNYNAVFAGYGFMAEDETMVAAMESAGLNFIGPCSRTVHDAGLKDEAKRTALKTGVSVTPGIDNGTALTLLRKYSDAEALRGLCTSEDWMYLRTRFKVMTWRRWQTVPWLPVTSRAWICTPLRNCPTP